ncbi:MAG TPA: RpoL/Rpb11 RNA polymerase subunit family protein [Candidatus Nitrosotenuis sp.]|jgi:DNA-directed RNA polymerase subunit L|nr:RpoL/Rpb11 RNA polymerase subunit family protein [Candidatus Nitrosotenuis sp.]
MNAQIVKSSSKETNLSIRGSDISTLYIIQHELLKDQQVEFAGVVLRHPLTNEYSMRVNSSKGNPIKEIEKATEAAIEFAEDLKQLIHSKIKGD